jgi:hypothetical protein
MVLMIELPNANHFVSDEAEVLREIGALLWA